MGTGTMGPGRYTACHSAGTPPATPHQERVHATARNASPPRPASKSGASRRIPPPLPPPKLGKQSSLLRQPHLCKGAEGPHVSLIDVSNLRAAHASFGHQRGECIQGCGSLHPRPKLQGHHPRWLGRMPPNPLETRGPRDGSGREIYAETTTLPVQQRFNSRPFSGVDDGHLAPASALRPSLTPGSGCKNRRIKTRRPP